MIDIKTIIKLKFSESINLRNIPHRYILISNEDKKKFLCITSQRGFLLRKNYCFNKVDSTLYPDDVFNKDSFVNLSCEYISNFNELFYNYNSSLGQFYSVDKLDDSCFNNCIDNLNIQSSHSEELAEFNTLNPGVVQE